MDIHDIRREQVLAEIISQRDMMLLNMSAELAQAREKIAELVAATKQTTTDEEQ